MIRYQNSASQVVPSLSGWLLQLRIRDENIEVQKTIEMYLPPLPNKVTEADTIYSYMSYLQGLAKDVNMPYVNITLDVGAAMNAYKTVWTFY